MTGTDEQTVTAFESVGGHAFFERLVGAFYARVALDPVLRPMYPEADLALAAGRLRLFFEQYWGGPTTYSEQRGHPRLRMRHAPYPVDAAASDRWLGHMRAALDEQMLPAELDALRCQYFQSAAPAMVNDLRRRRRHRRATRALPAPAPGHGNRRQRRSRPTSAYEKAAGPQGTPRFE